MSLQPNAPIGIGQIYASFDAASTAVFHKAMSASCGGVVRVQDLRLALLELSDHVPVEHVPISWRNGGGSDSPPSPCIRPATNDPRLRALLESAFHLALRLADRTPPSITTTVLWAAALSHDSNGSRDAFTVFIQLSRASTSSTEQRRLSVSGTTSIQRLTSARTEASRAHIDNNVAVILHKWLSLQRMTDDRSRHFIRTELEHLTATFDNDTDEPGTG